MSFAVVKVYGTPEFHKKNVRVFLQTPIDQCIRNVMSGYVESMDDAQGIVVLFIPSVQVNGETREVLIEAHLSSVRLYEDYEHPIRMELSKSIASLLKPHGNFVVTTLTSRITGSSCSSTQ